MLFRQLFCVLASVRKSVIVAHPIKATARDWYQLYSALKGAVDYCWPLQSIWIIETPRTPSEIISVLTGSGILDNNDGIIVLEITGVGNYRRVASQEVADWLDIHLTKA